MLRMCYTHANLATQRISYLWKGFQAVERIGFTSTIPVEVIFAADCQPVDLNNLFISHKDPISLVRQAEIVGLPRNCCAWIKGIFAASLDAGIRHVIVVTEGDCAQSRVLAQLLADHGVKVLPFEFPSLNTPHRIAPMMDRFQSELGTLPEDVLAWRWRLSSIRREVHHLDACFERQKTYSTSDLLGFQLSTTDFLGDPELFLSRLAPERIEFFDEDCHFPDDVLRLGIIGVPPIHPNLHSVAEELGAPIVFNETARQFTFPCGGADLVEQYERYTYNQSVEIRVKDINEAIKTRHLDGLIHYVQSFCYRHLEDSLFRSRINLPILTLEGELPLPLDARSRLRIESFVEMLGSRRRK